MIPSSHAGDGLDAQWLHRWRDDMTEFVASAMATFEARMGYPPGANRVGGPPDTNLSTAIDELSTLLSPDLALFSRIVGEVSLPDIGNGWFVLSPLHRARIDAPYNVDAVLFASDGGGTVYAVPAGQAGPVLRLREVGQTAPGVFDGERVKVSAANLRAFLDGLRDAVRLFTSAGDITDL